MKNQYFGDINDYLKYGLLRCISRAGLRVGVCWMLTPDDASVDGRKIGYLTKPSLRRYDPELFDALAADIRRPGGRNVRSAEGPSVLAGATFFQESVPDRALERVAWFEEALASLRGSDVLFFDPDNGLEVRSRPKGSRHSSKYLFWSEVAAAWDVGASLLLFQHYARVDRRLHAERLTRVLGQQAPGAAIAMVETGNVVFLLAVQPHHRPRAAEALGRFGERWSSIARVVHVVP